MDNKNTKKNYHWQLFNYLEKYWILNISNIFSIIIIYYYLKKKFILFKLE